MSDCGRMMDFAKCSAALLVVLLLSSSGCKKRSDSVAIHGHVSFRGEPLKAAGIRFFPAQGQPVTTAITQGAYATELPPGDYTVAITVGSELPPGYKEGDPLPPPPKIVLPDEYSVRAKSTLNVTVQKDQQDEVNFDLK